MTPPDIPAGPWLRTRDAARRLGVHPQTLTTWRWQRKGPAYRVLSSRLIVYHADDLDAWVRAHDAPRDAPASPPASPPASAAAGMPAPVAHEMPAPAPAGEAAGEAPRVLRVVRDGTWYGGAVMGWETPAGSIDEADAVSLGDVLEGLGVPDALIQQVEAAVLSPAPSA